MDINQSRSKIEGQFTVGNRMKRMVCARRNGLGLVGSLALYTTAVVLATLLGCGCQMDRQVVAPQVTEEVEVTPPPWMVLHAFADFLSVRAPTDKPVRLVVRDLSAEGVYGRTTDLGGFYLVEVDANLPIEFATEIVVHEWAHALVYNVNQDDHGPFWGVAYAEVYRAARVNAQD